MPKQNPTTDRDSIKFLMGAAVLTILISYIPFAFVLIYPLRLFVTFIHEGGHAIAALLTLGSVDKLQIFADASGVTYTRGGLMFVISSAGYLATSAFGALLLVLCSRGNNAKAVITVTAALILVLTAFFAGDPFSWVTGIMLAVGLIWIAIAARPRWAHFFLSFLAVQCCLNAFYDLRTLFLISTTTDMQSDALNMQQATMIPAPIWALIWIVLSVMTLIAALRKYAEGQAA